MGLLDYVGLFLDDSYITFRYAQHVAEGQGIVWNVGGEHTQGYTNFLFMMLIALGYALGVDPVHAANGLNLLGVALLGVSIYGMARLCVANRWLAAIPVFAVLCHSLTLSNAYSGLETMFWTGLIFAGAACCARALRDGGKGWAGGCAAFFAGAVLTRPEGAMIGAVWPLLLLYARPGLRKTALVCFGTAGVLLCAYLVWVWGYFGDVRPNSYYVKGASQSLPFPGLYYVTTFMGQVYFWPLLAASAAGMGLLAWQRREKARQCLAVLAPMAGTFGLLATMVHFFPIMGHYYRFLYPLFCAVTVFGLLPALVLAEWGLEKLRSRVMPCLFGAALVFSCVVLQYEPGMATVRHLTAPYPELAFYRIVIGKLEALPFGKELTVAQESAGMLPYYQQFQHIDTAGLNDNFIARHIMGEPGPVWRYVLDRKPDILVIHTTPAGGDRADLFQPPGYYPYLFTLPGFMDHYQYEGSVRLPSISVDAHVFVYKASPYRAALEEAYDKNVLFTMRDYGFHFGGRTFVYKNGELQAP